MLSFKTRHVAVCGSFNRCVNLSGAFLAVSLVRQLILVLKVETQIFIYDAFIGFKCCIPFQFLVIAVEPST